MEFMAKVGRAYERDSPAIPVGRTVYHVNVNGRSSADDIITLVPHSVAGSSKDMLTQRFTELYCANERSA
jgi:hypothetical protein